MVEQRYDAVRGVLDGATVKDTAIRNGVDRRTLHRWLVRYATDGLSAAGCRCAGVSKRSPAPPESADMSHQGAIGDSYGLCDGVHDPALGVQGFPVIQAWEPGAMGSEVAPPNGGH